MTPIQLSLLAYAATAMLLIMTPGLDTVMTVRAATSQGHRAGFGVVAGVTIGCILWGLAAALGVTALLTTSKLAFMALKVAGALYLGWMGCNLILKPRDNLLAEKGPPRGGGFKGGFRKGLMTNLLNPKVGLFVMTFLPQFIPAGANPLRHTLILVAILATLSCLWLCLLVSLCVPLGRLMAKPAVVRVFDRLAGIVFLAFGFKLLGAQAH
ncbi:LysE family translocator [Formicincola oecophyllae]|uniref:LysE family translocator n=1 Tax=Formicincola oecophyllae TaxID=2558361 RepID=A0A4Y6U912_9PROT|nr:LysE family translocator [Formicincola oecophyllae]QDH12871.1 LysE family translocator [Formicincola oecophyllae]